MYSIDFELYLLLTEYIMKIASGKQSIIIRAMVQDEKNQQSSIRAFQPLIPLLPLLYALNVLLLIVFHWVNVLDRIKSFLINLLHIHRNDHY